MRAIQPLLWKEAVELERRGEISEEMFAAAYFNPENEKGCNWPEWPETVQLMRGVRLCYPMARIGRIEDLVIKEKFEEEAWRRVRSSHHFHEWLNLRDKLWDWKFWVTDKVLDGELLPPHPKYQGVYLHGNAPGAGYLFYTSIYLTTAAHEVAHLIQDERCLSLREQASEITAQAAAYLWMAKVREKKFSLDDAILGAIDWYDRALDTGCYREDWNDVDLDLLVMVVPYLVEDLMEAYNRGAL